MKAIWNGAVIAQSIAALFEVALSLTKQVARDGEGATKLIEVCVDGATDGEQAKRVAKASGSSPGWGVSSTSGAATSNGTPSRASSSRR